MLVSTRGRYAIRMVLELSTHGEDEKVSLSELSEKQDISLKYAESIVALLVKEGILESYRGKFGGYRLSRPASDISVGEILKLTEDSLAPVACLDCKPNRCPKKRKCRTLPMWSRLNDIISDYLFSVSIEDIRNGNV